MRSVASLALLLLVLVASIDFLSWSQDEEIQRDEVLDSQRAHRIRAFSSGWNFPPVRQGITNQFEGALIDDRWCRAGSSYGLRLISIPSDGGEILLTNFKLLNSDQQLNGFIAQVANVPLNTTLVLASKQNFGKPTPADKKKNPARGEERREELGTFLRGIGVRSNPEEFKHFSFIYICVRRPWGFVPLAEKFSLTRGVSVSMNLDKDVTVYDEHAMKTVIDNRWLLFLNSEQATGEGLKVEATNRYLREMGYPSLRTTIDAGKSAQFNWNLDQVLAATTTPGTRAGEIPHTPDVPFSRDKLDTGGQVKFSAKLAWRFVPGDAPRALQFILRVNGRRMGDRVILNDNAEVERWILWEELLAEDIGPIEDLEVEVHRIGEGGPTVTVHLAEVRLSFGELYSF